MRVGPIDLGLLREDLLAAIREDVGNGDLTTRATIESGSEARAEFISKQNLIVCGVDVAGEVLRLCDAELAFKSLVSDGDSVATGSVLAEVRGQASSILTAERTTLNYLQRLSGIATVTCEYVARITGTAARLVDTRKTVPGMRQLDKYAVRCGGGLNHRIGLFDGVLLKNNHLAFHASVGDAIEAARRRVSHLVKLEVEVRTMEELREALSTNVDIIMLDNFTPARTREAVQFVAHRIPLESSGGITLDNVREFAEAGVDYISVGALTHSVTAADIHLHVFPE